MASSDACFTKFDADVSHIDLPQTFTFPFYYEPHPISIIAAEELQQRISAQTWNHNFGLEPEQGGMVIGKMFGVLVVKSTDGKLGYLAAFSGKLANENHHEGFVPPVYDMLQHDGYFRQEEEEINALNKQIEVFESDAAFNNLKSELETLKSQADAELSQFRKDIKAGKQERKIKREEAKSTLNDTEYTALEEALAKDSVGHQLAYKRVSKTWQERIDACALAYQEKVKHLLELKDQRKTLSNTLQKRLFGDYRFLNAQGESESLLTIFQKVGAELPPAGAGECAAPKLLHFAYNHGLHPVAMAEFWWGASPKSEVRRHKQFYPACRGKCEPILGHMLKGLNVDQNPMLEEPSLDQNLKILYEDEHLLALHKPVEFLSVPGKTITDSVYTRMKAKYPDATGPLIVHRLDMSTSGVMLIAKNKMAHERLQKQFLKRTVQKRYVALLDGIIEADQGEIDLPLRVDLNDRPRQLVCYEHGKPAKTKWAKVSMEDATTRVHFYPITGRTHQLRVHAAHTSGLNTPIVGDDLYGQRKERLYLHAEQITFQHPISEKTLAVFCEAEF